MDKRAQLEAFRNGITQFVTFYDAEWEIFIQYLSFSILSKKNILQLKEKCATTSALLPVVPFVTTILKTGRKLPDTLALKMS
ncbi:hypothetical protein [Pedobacter sp. P26]|uniref:hypothetical protein n=1 Tax=Pedobacter sp. P26 TaxID=3423956 RepID=UPI003D67B1EB